MQGTQANNEKLTTNKKTMMKPWEPALRKKQGNTSMCSEVLVGRTA